MKERGREGGERDANVAFMTDDLFRFDKSSDLYHTSLLLYSLVHVLLFVHTRSICSIIMITIYVHFFDCINY